MGSGLCNQSDDCNHGIREPESTAAMFARFYEIEFGGVTGVGLLKLVIKIVTILACLVFTRWHARSFYCMYSNKTLNTS